MKREEAIETLGHVVPFATQNGEKIAEAIDMAIEALSRPQGEWKGERVKSVGDAWEKTWYRCSKCKRHEYRKTNFCPNCGADMRDVR